MSRVKNFDATGIAPGGKLYAGDLNAIQDQYADLINYSQNHGVGTLAVGEAGLQLLRYAAGEARITGALRADGIVRGLGGLFAGQFTEAERNAIPAGKRPYGLLILNTTKNRYEWNAGSDATPNWIPTQPDTFPVGSAQPFFGSPSALTGLVEIPTGSGWLLCNGATFNNVDYPDLATFLGGAYGIPATGQTKLPDARERALLGMGTVDFLTRGAVGGSKQVALSEAQLASHTHIQSPHTHVQNSHSHPHSHEVRDGGGGGSRVREKNDIQGGGNVSGVVRGGTNPTVDTDSSATPATAVNQLATAVNQSAGGGQPHENMPPFLVIGGWLIKAKLVLVA